MQFGARLDVIWSILRRWSGGCILVQALAQWGPIQIIFSTDCLFSRNILEEILDLDVVKISWDFERDETSLAKICSIKNFSFFICIFYTQKTPKRGEHSWDQGIVSLEAIFSEHFQKMGVFVCKKRK